MVNGYRSLITYNHSRSGVCFVTVLGESLLKVRVALAKETLPRTGAVAVSGVKSEASGVSRSAVPAGGTGGRGGEDLRGREEGRRRAGQQMQGSREEECKETDEGLSSAAKS